MLGVPYWKERSSNIKKNIQKINLKISESSTKFNKVHLDIARESRILKKNFILKILKCIEMHYKSWFWSIFLWSFFDYCSCLLRNPWFRSYSFIYFPVPARWLSWEPNSVYCSIGTILLYSWNLSKSCDYISKALNTSLYMKS